MSTPSKLIEEPICTMGKRTMAKMIEEANHCSQFLHKFGETWVKVDDDDIQAIQSDTFMIEEKFVTVEWKSLRGAHRQQQVRFIAYYFNEDGDEVEIAECTSVVDAVFECWSRLKYWQYIDVWRTEGMARQLQWDLDHAAEIKEAIQPD